MRWQRGYTIVELVAVITITGVIAAVATTKWIGADAFEARGSYSTLLAALRYAQKTAIAQRTLVYVNINTTTKGVCLGYTPNCSTPVLDPATQAAYQKTLSRSVNLSVSANPLGFDGLGKPSPNQSATITVQNNVVTEAARTITIEQETGHVY